MLLDHGLYNVVPDGAIVSVCAIVCVCVYLCECAVCVHVRWRLLRKIRVRTLRGCLCVNVNERERCITQGKCNYGCVHV